MVTIGGGFGAHCGQIRASLRLRQVHGATPFTGDKSRQVKSLLFVAAINTQGCDHTFGQHGAQTERHIGRLAHLINGDGQHARHTLATKIHIGGQTHPPGCQHLLINAVQHRRSEDRRAIEPGSLRVCGLVGRSDHFAKKARGFSQDSVHHIRGGIFKTRQFRDLIHRQNVIEQKGHVGCGCSVNCHCLNLLKNASEK